MKAEHDKIEPRRKSEMTDLNFFAKHTNFPWLKDSTILLVRSGSHAYGLNVATSDEDFKGVAIPPGKYFHGFDSVFKQAEGKDPDRAIYDIRKFFALATQANPNILDLLYCDDADCLIVTDEGRLLREHRDEFLSLKAKHTFSGYAMSQLERIDTHRRWILHPPKGKPSRVDYGLVPRLDEKTQNQYGAALAIIKRDITTWDDLAWTELDPASKIALKEQIADYFARVSISKDQLWFSTGRSLGFEENFLMLLGKEKEFRRDADDWEHFLDWKAKRNPARAILEEKYRMDTKHAAHLVRLMTMCREILTTGKVIVKRTYDRELLLAIRNGAWTYEYLIEWAKKQDEELTALAKTSKVLPYAPDREKLDALCVEMVERWLSRGT